MTMFGRLLIRQYSYRFFEIGGEFDGDKKMEDLKLLYRAYVSDSLSGGRMEDNKVKQILAHMFVYAYS